MIEGNPQSQKAIDAGFVTLCYEALHVEITEPAKEGNTIQEARRALIKGTMQVALKRIPGGIKDQFSEKAEYVHCLAKNGMVGAWLLYSNPEVEYLYHFLFPCQLIIFLIYHQKS